MSEFQFYAEPWWVNLCFLIPFGAYYIWKKKGGLVIQRKTLFITFLFAAAFGIMEAAVVVYLRAAVGLLPGYEGTLGEVQSLASELYQQAHILAELPKSLLAVEIVREAATMVMLVCIALLAVKTRLERWGIYLWTFATWDIFYYVGLWATVRWPSSLLSPDVLFLIPVPWYSQVWFPFLVSGLTMIAVLAATKPK